jgi:hypothetical protein
MQTLGFIRSPLVKYLAAASLVVSGAALGWRAVCGPFHVAFLPVNSPLNAESVFGLSATALLLLNSEPGPSPKQIEVRHSVIWLLAIVLLSAAALWRALSFPLVFDDYTLVRQAQDMSPAALEYSFNHAGGDGFFRPFGNLSLHFDALWAAKDPFRWHLTGVALHLINVVLVWLLAGRFLADRLAALWAAALFAVHGTVLLTPSYLAARFDVLSVFLALTGLVLFLRYIDTGRYLFLAASVGCMSLALLTKETAFVFPFLAALICGPRAWAHRRALIGFFTVSVAVFAYRYTLFRGIGGYRDPLTGSSDVLRVTFLGYLKGFGLRIWSAFYFPVNWRHEPEGWLVVMLLAYMGALAWMAARTRGDRRKLMAMLAFTGVALLPVAHLLLVDASLLGAGRFYLALVGFAMLMAVAIRAATKPMQVLAGTLLLGFHLAALRHNLAIWGEIAALAGRTCANAAIMLPNPSDDLAVSGLLREIDGIPFLASGFEACVAFHKDALRENPAARHSEFRWDPGIREIVPN